MRAQMAGEIRSAARRAPSPLRAESKSSCGPASRRGCEGRGRRLLEDDVGVGAAGAEAGDAGDPRLAGRYRPRPQAGVDEEWELGSQPAGLASGSAELGGNSRCSRAQTVLIRLHMPAASPAWPMLDFTEPMAHELRFGLQARKPEPGRRSRSGRRSACRCRAPRCRTRLRERRRRGQSLGNDPGLPTDARREVADLVRAVVVDRRAADHGANTVAVAHGVREPLENDAADAQTP